MAELPEFDFSTYNGKDPWNFPPQRLVRFAFEAREIFVPSRNKWVRQRPFPDVRFVVFHELIANCYALGTYAMLVRDRWQEDDWWQGQPELPAQMERSTIQATRMNIRALMQFGFFHGVAKHLDSSFRQVLRSLDPEARENGSVGFSKVWRRLLEQTGLEDYEGLIKLIQLLRDALSSGGKFCPINRKDLTIVYRDKEYLFTNNEDLDAVAWGFIDLWDFMLFLLRDVDHLLNLLFESPFVAMIPHIRARHLEN